MSDGHDRRIEIKQPFRHKAHEHVRQELKYWVGIDARLADDETLKNLTLNAYNHVKEQYTKKGFNRTLS
ncbi:MAG: hypothetical protein IJJ90_02460 [Prevotella sp.]|nr:hypothetical protein [Prevotella sp.]